MELDLKGKVASAARKLGFEGHVMKIVTGKFKLNFLKSLARASEIRFTTPTSFHHDTNCKTPATNFLLDDHFPNQAYLSMLNVFQPAGVT